MAPSGTIKASPQGGDILFSLAKGSLHSVCEAHGVLAIGT